MPKDKRIQQKLIPKRKYLGDKVIEGNYPAEIWFTSGESIEEPKVVLVLNRTEDHPDDLSKENVMELTAVAYKPDTADEKVNSDFAPDPKEGNWKVIKIENFKLYTYNSGIIHLSSDGDIVIETNKDYKIYVGKDGEIEIKGDLDINVAGDLSIKNNNTIITSNEIKLGSIDAKQPFVLGFKLLSYLAKLYSWACQVGSIIGVPVDFESPPKTILSQKHKIE